MNKEDILITWIQKCEWHYGEKKKDNEFKRLKGIILELCFEREISKSDKFNIPPVLSCGWSYCIPNRSDNDNLRHWFILSKDYSDSEDFSKLADQEKKKYTNKLFAKKILNFPNNDRIFVISFIIQQLEPDTVPALIWRCVEFGSSEEGEIIKLADQRKANEYQKRISEKISDKISSLMPYKDNISNVDISAWLKKLPIRDLRRLFATRCLMNFGNLYLSDIDALAVNKDDELEMIEFKRKNPAMGDCYQPLKWDEGDGWLMQCDRASEYLKNLETSSEMLEKLYNEDNFNKVKKPQGCFGLDRSHYKNVFMCSKSGIKYCYIIFNSNKSDPKFLVNLDFKPIGDQEYHIQYIDENSFLGISKTNPKDSGTYSNNYRFQLMIPVNLFNKINII